MLQLREIFRKHKTDDADHQNCRITTFLCNNTFILSADYNIRKDKARMLFHESINHPRIICCVYCPELFCTCPNIMHAGNNPATEPKLEQKKCHIRAAEQVIVNNVLSLSKFRVEREMNDSSLAALCVRPCVRMALSKTRTKRVNRGLLKTTENKKHRQMTPASMLSSF